jgi:hypothetical protein
LSGQHRLIPAGQQREGSYLDRVAACWTDERADHSLAHRILLWKTVIPRIFLTSMFSEDLMNHGATITMNSGTLNQSNVSHNQDNQIFTSIVNLAWRDPILAASITRKSRGWKHQIAKNLQLQDKKIESVLSPERYAHLLTIVHDNPAGDVPSVIASDLADTRSTHGSCLHGTGTCASCLHQTGTCGTCAACVSYDVDSLL